MVTFPDDGGESLRSEKIPGLCARGWGCEVSRYECSQLEAAIQFAFAQFVTALAACYERAFSQTLKAPFCPFFRHFLHEQIESSVPDEATEARLALDQSEGCLRKPCL